MPSTMAYRQGDIVLVSFPFTDLTSSKRRPALVLSPDSFNAAGEDLVLAAVTSHITDDPHAVRLWRGDLAEGGLPKPIDGEGNQAVYDALLAHRQADRCPQDREDGGSPAVIAPFLLLRPDSLPEGRPVFPDSAASLEHVCTTAG